MWELGRKKVFGAGRGTGDGSQGEEFFWLDFLGLLVVKIPYLSFSAVIFFPRVTRLSDFISVRYYFCLFFELFLYSHFCDCSVPNWRTIVIFLGKSQCWDLGNFQNKIPAQQKLPEKKLFKGSHGV